MKKRFFYHFAVPVELCLMSQQALLNVLSKIGNFYKKFSDFKINNNFAMHRIIAFGHVCQYRQNICNSARSIMFVKHHCYGFFFFLYCKECFLFSSRCAAISNTVSVGKIWSSSAGFIAFLFVTLAGWPVVVACCKFVLFVLLTPLEVELCLIFLINISLYSSLRQSNPKSE